MKKSVLFFLLFLSVSRVAFFMEAASTPNEVLQNYLMDLFIEKDGDSEGIKLALQNLLEGKSHSELSFALKVLLALPDCDKEMIAWFLEEFNPTLVDPQGCCLALDAAINYNRSDLFEVVFSHLVEKHQKFDPQAILQVDQTQQRSLLAIACGGKDSNKAADSEDDFGYQRRIRIKANAIRTVFVFEAGQLDNECVELCVQKLGEHVRSGMRPSMVVRLLNYMESCARGQRRSSAASIEIEHLDLKESQLVGDGEEGCPEVQQRDPQFSRDGTELINQSRKSTGATIESASPISLAPQRADQPPKIVVPEVMEQACPDFESQERSPEISEEQFRALETEQDIDRLILKHVSFEEILHSLILQNKAMLVSHLLGKRRFWILVRVSGFSPELCLAIISNSFNCFDVILNYILTKNRSIKLNVRAIGTLFDGRKGSTLGATCEMFFDDSRADYTAYNLMVLKQARILLATESVEARRRHIIRMLLQPGLNSNSSSYPCDFEHLKRAAFADSSYLVDPSSTAANKEEKQKRCCVIQ